MKKEKLGMIDLFCGAGGLSEGFKQAGFKSLLGIDSDEDSLETFAHNHKRLKLFWEIFHRFLNEILSIK